MADPSTNTPRRKGPTPPVRDAGREAKRAAALRANLRRRKAAAGAEPAREA